MKCTNCLHRFVSNESTWRVFALTDPVIVGVNVATVITLSLAQVRVAEYGFVLVSIASMIYPIIYDFGDSTSVDHSAGGKGETSGEEKGGGLSPNIFICVISFISLSEISVILDGLMTCLKGGHDWKVVL